MDTMDTEGWIRVCATSELLPGEMQVAWDGDTPILVFNRDGDLYALEDRCSHEDFELSAVEFDPATGTIECVLHGAKFDVADSRALCPPAYEPAVKFPVRVHDGAVSTRDDRDSPMSRRLRKPEAWRERIETITILITIRMLRRAFLPGA